MGSGGVGTEEASRSSNGGGIQKPKIVVIMGPTGSGKSRLAIDLADHFPIEIINADSMQVYKGLDVLSNKVTVSEQKGVKHHLLGTISPDIEFTCKDFRDAAVPLINDIISQDRLPVIVGDTNFYIQALVSQFLLDDQVDNINDDLISDSPGDQPDCELNDGKDDHYYTFERLKSIDPLAANRIHPNDHRKVKQYIHSFERFGVPPSIFSREKLQRYNCCFICVDASLVALDQYVDQRVDRMIDAGLLEEVCDVYTLNADYTRGLSQAIGVREFEEFLCLLEEGMSKLKANTRRLVRRQKRRVNRLKKLFGWKIHHVDSTETLLGSSDDSWLVQVIEPSADTIRSFLDGDAVSSPDLDELNNSMVTNIAQKDLWTQYVCEACRNRVLRGDHELEQHRQGRGHRKRVSRLNRRARHGSNLTPVIQAQE